MARAGTAPADAPSDALPRSQPAAGRRERPRQPHRRPLSRPPRPRPSPLAFPASSGPADHRPPSPRPRRPRRPSPTSSPRWSRRSARPWPWASTSPRRSTKRRSARWSLSSPQWCVSSGGGPGVLGTRPPAPLDVAHALGPPPPSLPTGGEGPPPPVPRPRRSSPRLASHPSTTPTALSRPQSLLGGFARGEELAEVRHTINCLQSRFDEAIDTGNFDEASRCREAITEVSLAHPTHPTPTTSSVPPPSKHGLPCPLISPSRRRSRRRCANRFSPSSLACLKCTSSQPHLASPRLASASTRGRRKSATRWRSTTRYVPTSFRRRTGRTSPRWRERATRCGEFRGATHTRTLTVGKLGALPHARFAACAVAAAPPPSGSADDLLPQYRYPHRHTISTLPSRPHRIPAWSSTTCPNTASRGSGLDGQAL